MEKSERQKMADASMSELIELEKTSNTSLDGIELNNRGTMQRPQETDPLLNVDASAKVVVSDNKLEANMCVFSPQFSGKDITVEAMRQALKDGIYNARYSVSTLRQLRELNELLTIISDKDADAMKRYLTKIREHIK